MIKNLLSYESRTITGAAIILGGASFLSRLIGLVRDRLFAHYFGAGDVLDAYYAAFRIPDFIFNILLAGAITAGFVPVFIELWKKNQGEGWRLTSNLITLIGGLMAIASTVAYVFAPQLTSLITPGFSGAKLELTISLTRIMLISPIILGVSGVVSSVLHAFRQFAVFSLAPLIYNLAIIISTIALVPLFGPVALAWGVVIGAILHLAVQIPAVYGQGYRYALQWKIITASVKEVVTLIIPRTLGMMALQINLIILTSLASVVGAGSVAIFNLAQNLYYVPIGLIGHAFALAAFPVFASAAADKKIDELVAHFAGVVRQTLFLVIPATIIVIMLRAQIVRVVLGSGKFDWTDTVLTADTLGMLAISLAAHCIMLVTARALFALKKPWATFWAAVFGVMVTFALGFSLKNYFGVLSLGLALSGSIILQTAYLWFVLRREIKNLHEGAIVMALAKISVAGAALALAGQGAKEVVAMIVDMTRFWGILSQGLVCGMVGILTYGLVCHWLKLEELALFKESFRKRWLKLWQVSEKIEG